MASTADEQAAFVTWNSFTRISTCILARDCGTRNVIQKMRSADSALD